MSNSDLQFNAYWRAQKKVEEKPFFWNPHKNDLSTRFSHKKICVKNMKQQEVSNPYLECSTQT